MYIEQRCQGRTSQEVALNDHSVNFKRAPAFTLQANNIDGPMYFVLTSFHSVGDLRISDFQQVVASCQGHLSEYLRSTCGS